MQKVLLDGYSTLLVRSVRYRVYFVTDICMILICIFHNKRANTQKIEIDEGS